MSYREAGYTENGVYRIQPDLKSALVYCDMSTSMTTIQRRFDGSVDFQRTFTEYERGFGDVEGSYWLGNELIYDLTKIKNRTLLVEFEALDGEKNNTKFSNFILDGPHTHYGLSSDLTYQSGSQLGIYFLNSRNNQFLTVDRADSRNSCHQYYLGWWLGMEHGTCERTHGNLNGLYTDVMPMSGSNIYMSWGGVILRRSSMKIR